MSKRKPRTPEQEREEHWHHVVGLWTEVRNDIPQDVMDAVGEFSTRFYKLANQHSLASPHALVALSSLIAPLLSHHLQGRPENVPIGDWHRAFYGAMTDAVTVAHALLAAVLDGAVVADEETKTLRSARLH